MCNVQRLNSLLLLDIMGPGKTSIIIIYVILVFSVNEKRRHVRQNPTMHPKPPSPDAPQTDSATRPERGDIVH